MGAEGEKPTPEAMQLLMDILAGNPGAIKKAMKLMDVKEETERKTVKVAMKNYRFVLIHTQCEHCGFVSHRRVQLTKAESITYTSKYDRQVYIVRFTDCKDLLHVEATTRSCNACAEFINSMDVEELKIRYWNLLNNNPLDMKHPPKQNAAHIKSLSEALAKKYDSVDDPIDSDPEPIDLEDSIEQEVIEYAS